MKRNIFIIFVIFLLPSCGGGTSGTSQTGVRTLKVVNGSVTNGVGVPVQNARIEIEQSSTTTDRNGAFSLSTEFASSDNVLFVQTESFSQATQLPIFSDNTSALSLDISLDENQINVSNFELILNSIGGKGCENGFTALQVFNLNEQSSPLLISDQIKPLARNTKCLANFHLSENGSPAAGTVAEIYFFPVSRYRLENPILLGKQIVNINGQLLIEFQPDLKLKGLPGYFTAETPVSKPLEQRAVIIINPFLKE